MLTESIIPAERTRQKHWRGLLSNATRRVVLSAFERIREGNLEVHDQDSRMDFGDCRAAAAFRARISIQDPRFYQLVASSGALGAGAAYIEGLWSCDDLTTLIRIIIRNREALRRLDGPWTLGSAAIMRAWNALHRNTRLGSHRNIAAHYDLSNDFYGLFLDDTMTYSCGIFEGADSTLGEASTAKLDRICRKLNLRSADHVLEIGGGWGSFAIYAASTYGCRVTTTTISRRQYEFAAERVKSLGLTDRITVLQRDYRDLGGHYDKLVSIEMIEAVGWQYYDVFLRKCGELLKADGMACIQAITMPDREYERAKRSVDFIKRHVFPGSCIPSIGAIAGSIARATPLTVAHLEDITPHYARTLCHWRDRFSAAIKNVRAMNLSEAFIRLWEYYLCYCEAGFRERAIGCVQMVLVGADFRGDSPLEKMGTGVIR